jgi:hypothetical protein
MYYWAIAILLILLFLYIRSAMCEQRTRKEGFDSRDARKELLESQVGVLNSIKNEATKMLQKYINKRIEFAGKVDEEFRYSLPGEF